MVSVDKNNTNIPIAKQLNIFYLPVNNPCGGLNRKMWPKQKDALRRKVIQSSLFSNRYTPLLRSHFRGVLLFVLLCQACQAPKKFDQFDATTWKNDRLGCQGNRQRLAAEFEKIRRELRGLTQSEISELLGKPDLQGLYTRHQRFFVYYLEAGPHCQDSQTPSTARTVAVRFGALGYVTEVSYQQGRP